MRSFSLRIYCALVLCISALTLSACGKDETGSASCSSDSECSLGTVCTFKNICEAVPCNGEAGNYQCTPEQICYKADAADPGTCSAPQCLTDADCADGRCNEGVCSTGGCVSNSDCADDEICNLLGECETSDGTCIADADCPNGQVCKDDACVEGCSGDDDCADGEYCTADQTCEQGCRDSMECPSGQVCTDGDCACTADSCPDGKVCLDTGNCGDPTDCSQVTCPDGEVCNPADLGCLPACTDATCMANEVCNPQTGLCEVSNCPGEDPTQCMGNAARPLWDPIRCFCAECLSDADCDAGAGETCNAAGACFACVTACDAATPNTCGQAGTPAENQPYCINDCCVECVGAADCQAGQLCLDGFCGDPPNCSVDPSVCPAGYTCTNGQCQAPTGGQACDQNDPLSCPDGTFCDPATSTCTGDLGGLFGCGLCNPDCTCDGGLTCDGFFCTGCNVLTQDCPSGFCIPQDPIGDPLGPTMCFG